jgi:hypothetical protein
MLQKKRSNARMALQDPNEFGPAIPPISNNSSDVAHLVNHSLLCINIPLPSRITTGWKSVRPYLSLSKINYRVMIGNPGLAARYGADQALPVTLVIDRAGRIAATHTGVVSKSDCRAEIEALL